MTVSAAVAIIYLQNKEPIWQAAWILSAVCVTRCMRVWFFARVRERKSAGYNSLCTFSGRADRSPLVVIQPFCPLRRGSDSNFHGLMIGIVRIMRCAAGTTLLFDGTRYRAQIIGLLPAGPSFALLFSRESALRERARAFACTVYWWNFIFSIAPPAWIRNSTSTTALAGSLTGAKHGDHDAALRRCPPVHIKHWIQIKL